MGGRETKTCVAKMGDSIKVQFVWWVRVNAFGAHEYGGGAAGDVVRLNERARVGVGEGSEDVGVSDEDERGGKGKGLCGGEGEMWGRL